MRGSYPLIVTLHSIVLWDVTIIECCRRGGTSRSGHSHRCKKTLQPALSCRRPTALSPTIPCPTRCGEGPLQPCDPTNPSTASIVIDWFMSALAITSIGEASRMDLPITNAQTWRHPRAPVEGKGGGCDLEQREEGCKGIDSHSSGLSSCLVLIKEARNRMDDRPSQ